MHIQKEDLIMHIFLKVKKGELTCRYKFELPDDTGGSFTEIVEGSTNIVLI